MARIRNIKPEFFSHEELQDMEVEHPELHPMLVFSALWTQCEWSGVFSWSIRKLKLSILPFLEFDLEISLGYLEKHGFIKKFSRDGKDYGYVYNFTKYQAISGNEKSQSLKYPVPTKKELERDYTDTVPEQSQDSPKTIPGQESDNTESPDSDSDIGHRTKDINSSGSAERKKPEALPPGGIKSPDPKKPKKPPLREREPENDYERVEKAYLQNWDTLYGQGKVKTADPVVNWNQTRALLKRHFEKIKPDQIITALKNGMADNFVLSGGYSLATMLAASVLNRLINAKQGQGPPPALEGKKSLGGLDSW
jgi:hypothetical protein